MLRIMVLLACLLWGIHYGWSAASPEKEIRDVMDRQAQAWNRGDIKSYMAGYANSLTTVFVGKDIQRGYQQVLDRYLKGYPTPARMGKLTFSDIEVHPIGASDAWVLGRWHLERTAEGGGNTGGVYTLLFHREAAGWRIVLDHTT